jgi:DTW domain-containing protein YfiP
MRLPAPPPHLSQLAGVCSAGLWHPVSVPFPSHPSPSLRWWHTQSRKELKRNANSVALLRLCLTPPSLHVLSSCHPNRNLLRSCPAFHSATHDGCTPLLLYPRAENSLTETDVSSRARAGERFCLIVPDGSWAETTKISGEMKDVEAFGLDAGKYKGLFSLRRPKCDGYLSTLEAVAYALDTMQPLPVSPQLLRPMLRACLQEEAFAVRRGAGVKHRPDAPGYRVGLMDDVRAAAAALDAQAAAAAADDDDDDAAAAAPPGSGNVCIAIDSEVRLPNVEKM